MAAGDKGHSLEWVSLFFVVQQFQIVIGKGVSEERVHCWGRTSMIQFQIQKRSREIRERENV